MSTEATTETPSPAEPPDLDDAIARAHSAQYGITTGQVERRVRADVELELRTEENADGEEVSVLQGYAAVFDTSTRIWFWDEKIKRGAFAAAVRGDDDVRALWNHNSDTVLGRNRAGTLELTEDDTGLRVRIHVDMANPEIASKVRQVQRGDVSQMSFGFIVLKEEIDDSGERQLRTILEVELYDVSPVTYPAYPTTTVEARDRMRSRAALANPPPQPRHDEALCSRLSEPVLISEEDLEAAGDDDQAEERVVGRQAALRRLRLAEALDEQ